jgi:His-Xaa-Ser system protein HxsD
MQNLADSRQNNQIILEIDSSIYSKSCLFKTCYKFTDRAYVFLSRSDMKKNIILVSFTAKNLKIDSHQLSGEFLNELID